VDRSARRAQSRKSLARFMGKHNYRFLNLIFLIFESNSRSLNRRSWRLWFHMDDSPSETKGFAAAVIDALSSHICVTDKKGVIVTVNRAWRDFAAENPPVSVRTGVGTHYLELCRNASGPGSDEAEDFGLGVESVLKGGTELFQMEYPCHSPTQNRWFLGRVTPLRTQERGAVISHMAVTDRKLLEQELVRLATIDSLTGLSNRRYFLEIAAREVERVKRFGAAASMVMIDLDHFKAVNDTYGHAMGDEALRSFAQVCKQALRKVDVLARLGGEEFVVLLPGTNETGAVDLAERLRLALGKTSIKGDQNQFRITASFGVSEVCANDEGVDKPLGRADSALYAAKRAGRNCVVGFGAIPS
jgi:diguanylate cyclase (GGDEF)-like protein